MLTVSKMTITRIPYTLTLIISAYSLLYVLFYTKESPSILEQYEVEYLLMHAVLLTGIGFLWRAWIKCNAYWKVILLGMLIGWLLSLPVSGVSAALFLDDGINRLLTSYTDISHIGYALLANLIYALYHGLWLIGGIVFFVIKRVSL